MGWWPRRSAGGAGSAAGSVRLGRRDRVLASATETWRGCSVVATIHELIVVGPDGVEELRRRWLDVDAGGWENLTGTISVTWADGSRAHQWTFGPDAGRRFAEAFRDRVQASVLLDAPVEGPQGRLGRAAIRRDLRTGDLIPQVLWDRRARRADPEVVAAGDAVLAALKERVGL